MLLTDEEIEAMFAKANDGYVGVMQNDVKFARAIEAAILAKLASTELPEPTVYSYNARTHMNVLDAYTADQLRQAYAQGAAAQLAEKPCGEVSGSDPEMAILYSEFEAGTPIYTRRQA